MAWLLILLESILLSAFTVLDVIDSRRFLWVSTGLKYAGILLCLLYAAGQVLRIRKERRRFLTDQSILLFALTFTALADLFLLFPGGSYLFGIAFFIPVQLIYLLRILGAEQIAYGKSYAVPALVLRIAVIIAAWAALLFLHLEDATTRLAALYFVNLLLNVIHSQVLFWKQFRLPKEACRLPLRPLGLFAAGLTLFLCCDVSVGLWNLPGEVAILPASFREAVLIAMWTFYLPSQVLLTLSGSGKHYKENERGK